MIRLLAPRSVAVVGGTEREGAYGSEALLNLGRVGFEGSMYAVNPGRDVVHGVPCFPSLSALPEAVDAVVVAVPAAAVTGVIEEASSLGCGGAVVFAAGYAEIGDAAAQAGLAAAAADLPVCGPNGNGIVSPVNRVALWGDVVAPIAPGPVALVTQSGNLAVNALASRRGLGLHTVVSCGNAAVLAPADFVEAIAALEGVRSIALYLEDDGDGERWCDALLACAEADIGVAVLKAGTSPTGAAAAAAHTGAVAGDQRAVRAFFEECGAAWAEDPHDLLETARALATDPRDGSRLGVMTCSGGDSALAADLAADLGIELAPPASPAVAALLPPQATVGNPLDYTTLLWDDPDRLAQLVAAYGAEYDRLLVLFDEPHDAPPSWAAVLGAICSSPQPLTIASTLPELAPVGAVPGLRTGLRVAAALGKRPPGPARIAAIRDVARNGRHGDHNSERWLSEPEAKALLGDLVPEGRVVATPDEAVAAAAALGRPVAVKVVNADLQHKAIVGGVRLDPPDIAAAARDLLSLGDAVLVERMVEAGPETLVAVRTDTIVPVLVVGTEILPLPVERGALDPDIADVALRAVEAALEHGLALLELNPVIGGLAVDAVAAIPKQGVPA